MKKQWNHFCRAHVGSKLRGGGKRGKTLTAVMSWRGGMLL